MDIDILIQDERWSGMDLENIAQRAGAAVCEHLTVPADCSFAILACNDDKMSELNGEFRDKQKPTNVLSWPSEDLAADTAGGHPYWANDPEIGDVAISYETCVREAQEQDKPIVDHLTHLMIHAILHLLGYDHIDDKDADLMEGIEVEILAKLSISNPYIEI